MEFVFIREIDGYHMVVDHYHMVAQNSRIDVGFIRGINHMMKLVLLNLKTTTTNLSFIDFLAL
jgi:hypothetical protein